MNLSERQRMYDEKAEELITEIDIILRKQKALELDNAQRIGLAGTFWAREILRALYHIAYEIADLNRALVERRKSEPTRMHIDSAVSSQRAKAREQIAMQKKAPK